MGEAVSVPGPLPAQPDEPRPLPLIGLISQPVAVLEVQGGRLLPICVGCGLLCAGPLGTGSDAVPHPPIRIPASSSRPDLTPLDILVYAATAPRDDPSLLPFKLGNARGTKEFGWQTYGCIEFRPRRAVKDPDSALKQSAVAGDRVAVERLFRELYPSVYGFCFTMTRNRTEAEDLAQQTFLKAFASLRQFRPAQPIGPWILRIAHNLFISQLRSRRPQTDLDDPGLEPLTSNDPMPEAAAISQETREQVRRALQSLAPPAQVVLVLRYQQRLSYEEIAAVIDKPVTTVTNRLFEARRQLGRALRQTGEGGNDAYELVGS